MTGNNIDIDLSIVRERMTVFQTSDGYRYAEVECDNHCETHGLPSEALERWVRAELQKAAIALPSQTHLQTFFKGLEAEAHTGGLHPDYVHRRVGIEKGKIFLDLGNPEWNCVEIGPKGWAITDESPVYFSRSKGMLELPAPKKGGSIDDLRRFINVGDREFVLIVGWLLAVLGGRGPYPVLVITGEAGSAKTTVAWILRMLVDPHNAGISSPPKSEADLVYSASIGRVIVLDNVSAMPPWLSDAICRVSTGFSFAGRRGNRKNEQETLTVEASVILTGIGDLALRADLADRAITVDLEPIPETRRKLRNALQVEFENARPRLLGALLDGVAEGLRNANTTAPGYSRMADLEHWVSACETAFWPAGTFMEVYRANQSHTAEDALDGDPVARGLRDFLETTSPFEGTHQELLQSLVAFQSTPPGGRTWPATPKALSSALRRAAPNLRKTGVVLHFSKRSGGNRDRIVRAEIEASRDARPVVAAPSSAIPKRPKKRTNVPQQSLFPEDEIQDLPAKVELVGTVGTVGSVALPEPA
jgi:hypothetical protein